jgi:hypothetical protein
MCSLWSWAFQAYENTAWLFSDTPEKLPSVFAGGLLAGVGLFRGIHFYRLTEFQLRQCRLHWLLAMGEVWNFMHLKSLLARFLVAWAEPCF